MTDSEKLAIEVIAGKWGNGAARMNALTSSGYNASQVQDIVNQMLAGTYGMDVKKYEPVEKYLEVELDLSKYEGLKINIIK